MTKNRTEVRGPDDDVTDVSVGSGRRRGSSWQGLGPGSSGRRNQGAAAGCSRFSAQEWTFQNPLAVLGLARQRWLAVAGSSPIPLVCAIDIPAMLCTSRTREPGGSSLAASSITLCFRLQGWMINKPCHDADDSLICHTTVNMTSGLPRHAGL